MQHNRELIPQPSDIRERCRHYAAVPEPSQESVLRVMRASSPDQQQISMQRRMDAIDAVRCVANLQKRFAAMARSTTALVIRSDGLVKRPLPVARSTGVVTAATM
jgi:hypothetical protein